jgi:anti-sigma regulatory factor (Ser/Thr protein kinase)
VGWARTLPLQSTPKTARDWALEHLEALDWTENDPQTVDAVLITVSELVTNAHVHAHSHAQLAMTWDGRCLHIAVRDRSTEVPKTRPPSSRRPGGRGMFLVDALADDWETRPCKDGKTVVACFRPSAAAGNAH